MSWAIYLFDGAGNLVPAISRDQLSWRARHMSWNVYLCEEHGGKPVTVPPYEGEGGTYVVGGSDEARLNVTYNYSEVVMATNIFDGQGLREFLHGKVAANVIPALERAVEQLGTKQYRDYWAPTPGNLGHALAILLRWARQHPNAIFEVS